MDVRLSPEQRALREAAAQLVDALAARSVADLSDSERAAKLDAALAGADCCTIPPSVFRALYKHALTDAGLAAFMKDWNASGQKIV